jgi:hypothetical protein
MTMNRSIAARIGLVCSVAALSLVGASARAEEGVAFKNLMANMGLVSPEKDPIRYRERAPLVLPPKMELPAPAAGGLAANDPQWPKDPDVEAKRRRSAEERMPVTSSEIRRMSDNNARLSIDEIRAGRSQTSPTTDPSLHRGDNARDVTVLSPDQLRATAKHNDDDDAKLADGVEPTRRSLTEPPAGMRKAAGGGTVAGSRSNPAVDQQQYDANPMNWLTRKFSSDND